MDNKRLSFFKYFKNEIRIFLWTVLLSFIAISLIAISCADVDDDKKENIAKGAYEEEAYLADPKYSNPEHKYDDIEEKTVKVRYVPDFSAIEADPPTYWYYAYNTSGFRGYSTYKSEKGYFSFADIRKHMREKYKGHAKYPLNDSSYIEITFFKQITEVAHLEEKNNGK